MTSKTDPYATKTQKRVDALLIAFIVLAVALLLRPTAKGQPFSPLIASPSFGAVVAKARIPVASQATLQDSQTDNP